MAKLPPAAAFNNSGAPLRPAPDTGKHPLAPTAPSDEAAVETVKLVQFSARIDPELYRRVKIACAVRGVTIQAAADEALTVWVDTASAS